MNRVVNRVARGVLTVLCALAPGVGFRDAAAGPPERRDEAVGGALPEGVELRGSLVEALAVVVREHDRLFRLEHPRLDDGPADREAFEAFVEQVAGDFEPWLPDVELSPAAAVDLHLHRIGWEAFHAAWTSDTGLRPEHLQVLLDPRLLRAPPVVESSVWREAKKKAADEGDADAALPAVGNTSAFYLLFGALHDAAFWERRGAEDEGDEGEPVDPRSRALLEWLELGLENHRVSGQVVRRALDSPLVWPVETHPDFRTSARFLPDLAGPVGFTREHLEFVRDAYDQAVEELLRRGGRNAAGDDELLAARLGWLEDLLRLILRELGGADASLADRRRRAEAWSLLASTATPEEYRDRLMERIETLLEEPPGLRPVLPIDESIGFLLRLGAARSGVPPEEVAATGEGLDDREPRS